MSTTPFRRLTPVVAIVLAACVGEPIAPPKTAERPGTEGADQPVAAPAAGDATWDGGAGNGLWSDPDNWVGDALPSASADIEIPADAGTIHVDLAVTIEATLTIGRNTIVEVDAGQTLTVNGDVTLSGFPVPQVVNRGTITGPATGSIAMGFTNEATGVVNGIEVEFRSVGANHGSMSGVRLEFGNPAGIIVENTGTITNATIRIRDPFIAVHSRLVNQVGGTITGGSIEVGGPANSSGFVDFGDLTNHGTISGANIDVWETFDNDGTVTVGAGSVELQCDAQRQRFGAFVNTGTLTGPLSGTCVAWDGGGDGTTWTDPLNWNVDRVPGPGATTTGVTSREVYVVSGAAADVEVHLDASQDFANGRLDILGRTGRLATLVVDPGVTLSFSTVSSPLSTSLVLQRGILVNDGTTVIRGRFFLGLFSTSQVATVENNGSMTLHHETFVRSGTELRNHGTLVNLGTIDNDGTIESDCGAPFTEGTILGDPVIYESCNEPPVAKAGADQTVTRSSTAGAVFHLDGSSSSDPDGTISTYEWFEGSTLRGTGATPTVTLASLGAHTITLRVTDDAGATDEDQVILTALNAQPAANAGVDQTRTRTSPAGAAFPLNGSASSDVDGTIATYQWREGSTVLAAGATPTITLAVLGDHVITLRVTDSDGATAEDQVTLTVVNAVPVAAAGDDQRETRTSPAGAVFALDGSGSSDPDGSIASHQWLEGTTLLATGATPGITLAALGDHFVTLRVTDNDGAIDEDEVMLTVNNAIPSADAGVDQVVECAGPGDAVTLDGSGSRDVDGTISTYEWFEDGSPLATGSSPSVHLPVGAHDLTLRVTDNDGATSEDHVEITVQDTHAPTVHLSLLQNSLSPANHAMVRVASGISASDVCDPGPALVVTVASNEPVNGAGDGNSAPDWQVVQNSDGTVDVWVRAERNGGGKGRIYTITATATDASGNATTASAVVSVPHDQGR